MTQAVLKESVPGFIALTSPDFAGGSDEPNVYYIRPEAIISFEPYFGELNGKTNPDKKHLIIDGTLLAIQSPNGPTTRVALESVHELAQILKQV